MFVFTGYNWSNLERIRSTAAKAESRARSAEIDLTRLVARVESLSLACQAMWELLRDRTDLCDDDIQERMKEIDMRDGREDGRLKGSPLDCPGCGRPTNTRRKCCMYCGKPIVGDHVFDK